MEQNNENSPESRQKELLDLAYNIVPEGAEYDVFSENTSKEIKPTLLYDNISVNNTEKADTNAEKEKADDLPKGEIEYDMFSENIDTNPEPSKPVNREYLDRLYTGGIDISDAEIRMTRSDYIAEYNRINEHDKKEKRKCKINFFCTMLIAAFGISVIHIIKLLQINLDIDAQTKYLYMILNGLRFGAIVATPIISGFLLVSSIKSIKKAKETQRKALERLEQRKEELMVLGLYDTAN